MRMKLLKFLPLLGLLLFCAMPSYAAIAHDADSNAGNSVANAATFTWNHTCTCASNGAIVVWVVWNDSNVGVRSVSSVTYNGVTVVQAQNGRDAGNSIGVWFGVLAAPATGTNVVSVTMSTALGAVGAVTAGATSFTGVNQATPLDSAGFVTIAAPAQGVNITGNVTTVAANAWIIDAVCGSGHANGYTVVAPQTQVVDSVTATTGMPYADSYNGPIVTPASTADSWAVSNNNSTTGPSILAAISIAPAGVTSGGAKVAGPSRIAGPSRANFWNPRKHE